MTDITELALIKGQKVEAPYYLAECTECGKMYSSSKLIVSRNYFDGDADCYCPHCNADDADIADLGSGEQPAVMAWNYQQARIDVLVEALEKAQAINAAAEKLVRCKGRYHSEQNYRALAALFGVNTPDLPPLEHENVHHADAAEMEIEALRQRIAELESRTVTVKLPEGDERDDLVISIMEEIAHLQRCVERYRKEEMASTTQEMEQRLLVQQIALSVVNSAAGIKVEAE
ncbi:ead/Ea22-like family protein [Klebsiella pneumoniae]|uniref:ead/Ea22-like family protein n=1 Tax=Klebsiella pneumoniae TaxID=573 RepID=UPI00211AADD1|nr:ead/Ea22-like family protein [Klebsiella pneumoniae]